MALTRIYNYKCDRCGREPRSDDHYDSIGYGWGLLGIEQADTTGMGHNEFFREKLLCNECRKKLVKFLAGYDGQFERAGWTIYPNASTEPLEVIRTNECDASPGLATSRFQRLWNEIEFLRTKIPF